LIRIRNALISFIGAYVAALIFSMGNPLDALKVFSASVSAAFILGGGNALNDYFDVEIDKINKPKRPIPSGRISKSDTFMLSLAFFLIGIGISKSINDICLYIASINTVLLLIYARYSKRLLVASNLIISYLVASVFIYGAAASVTPGIEINEYGLQITLILTLCAFFINLSREILKDIEDVEGDSITYSLTIPIKYGPDIANKIALTSAAVAVAVSLVPIISAAPGFNQQVYGAAIIITDIILLSAFMTPPSVGQKILITGMILALISFSAGVTVS
jgi:geranylgeranylglycerol-phosphate geranylgeranyltransferase